jgi:hypothetical protein
MQDYTGSRFVQELLEYIAPLPLKFQVQEFWFRVKYDLSLQRIATIRH